MPAQAVFDKGGQPTVYVVKGKRTEAREVKLVKRSESMMVLAGGVAPGEILSLSDPNPKAEGRKGKGDKKGGGAGAMGAMPAGGKQ